MASDHADAIATSAAGDILDLLGHHAPDDDASAASNAAMYEGVAAADIYRNFLDWLFATFHENEELFRARCLSEMGAVSGKRVLIIGCGLGEDVAVTRDLVGPDGVVHAQDLSRTCVELTAKANPASNVFCSVSDAQALPYRDGVFDAVYHTGGINLFGDIPGALSEMARVCKLGGVIVFGDESIAPHLRQTEYGRMFLSNNPLWGADLPLQHLPVGARDIRVSYVLGNCFYLIRFTNADGPPSVDIDVPHLGYRGGSVRSRHFGVVEGIDVDLKRALYDRAQQENTSVSAVLAGLVRGYLGPDPD
ncbi:MAG: class I SAM-dependent methyltransferase [Thalassovita sp.]